MACASTVGSNDFGLWNDNLDVVAIGGSKELSAVRSQSFSVNGFSFSTQQTQSTILHMRRYLPSICIVRNCRPSFRSALLASALFFSMLHGEAANESELWNILSVGVDSAGSSAQDVLSLLGTIHDQRARALIEQTLQGTNGLLITYVAKGLTRRECISYLSDLPEIMRCSIQK